MVSGLAGIWFWRQLDRRLHWNELQQAQTDTFMGAERERVDDVQGGMFEELTMTCGHSWTGT